VRNALLPQEDAEDDEIDHHQRKRVDERPGDAEHRPAVTRVEVAPEQVREELSVPNEVGVHRHPTKCTSVAGYS
jgi:hypothetical protein